MAKYEKKNIWANPTISHWLHSVLNRHSKNVVYNRMPPPSIAWDIRNGWKRLNVLQCCRFKWTFNSVALGALPWKQVLFENQAYCRFSKNIANQENTLFKRNTRKKKRIHIKFTIKYIHIRKIVAYQVKLINRTVVIVFFSSV